MGKSAGRKERLAAALRANLKRRKARERARAGVQARMAPAGEGPAISSVTTSGAEAASLPHPRRNMAQKGE